VNKDAVADPGERKAIRLIHPPPNRAGMALQLAGEGLKVRVFGQQAFEIV
jgi:hypothetical protein